MKFQTDALLFSIGPHRSRNVSTCAPSAA